MHKTNILTKQQQIILTHIYRFRFTATKHFQQILNVKYLSNVQPRLQILLDEAYIARHYPGQNKLNGKPAAYFLLPAGMKALKAFDSDVNASSLHNAYADKSAEASFIHHCLVIADINLELTKQFGDDLEFFTRAESKDYRHYFPTPLPDGYILIADASRPRHDPWHYFIEVFDDVVPRYALRSRIRQYIDYIAEGEWQTDPISMPPGVLLVCETESRRKKLERIIQREIEASYQADLKIQAVTIDTIQEVISAQKTMTY
jgi:hypothetical protein